MTRPFDMLRCDGVADDVGHEALGHETGCTAGACRASLASLASGDDHLPRGSATGGHTKTRPF